MDRLRWIEVVTPFLHNEETIINDVLKRFTGLFALLLMAVGQPLLAKECQGVNLPDQLQVSGKTLQFKIVGRMPTGNPPKEISDRAAHP